MRGLVATGLLCIGIAGGIAGCGGSVKEAATTYEVDANSGGIPEDPDVDFEPNDESGDSGGSDSGGLDEPAGSDDAGSSEGGSGEPEPADADFEGVHDGTYQGSLQIDFVNDISNGSCIGTVTFEVNLGHDPPIQGEGECTLEAAGMMAPGSAVADGHLELGLPVGDVSFTVAGEPHDVTWNGQFDLDSFVGDFTGQGEVFGQLYTYEGNWDTLR